MTRMTGGQLLAESLKKMHVSFVFGYPGGPCVPLFENVLVDEKELHHIMVRHEATASLMANGYARASGRPQACYANPGPGAVHLMHGVADAFGDAVPLLGIIPIRELETEQRGVIQEMNHSSLFRDITKWAYRISRCDRIPEFVRRALFIAQSGRPGPVALEIPAEMGNQMVDTDIPDPAKFLPESVRVAGDPASVSKAVDVLMASERPVMICGNQVTWSEATPEVLELAEAVGIPVATTLFGKGAIPENHLLSIGTIGSYHEMVSKATLAEADAALLVGLDTALYLESADCRDPWFDIPESARIVQLNRDVEEIGKLWPCKVGIVGDPKLVLKQISNELKQRLQKPRKYTDLAFIQRLSKNREEFDSKISNQMSSNASPISPLRVMKELQKFLDQGDILVPDVSIYWYWMGPYLKVIRPRTFHVSNSYMGMGFSVGAAMGAKLACPSQNVVGVVGDGAFYMYCADISTAVQYKIPAVWWVMNNYSTLWVKSFMKEGRAFGVDLPREVDFVKVCEGLGAFSTRVERPEDFQEAIKGSMKAGEAGRPSVIDIVVDPKAKYPPGYLDHRDARLKFGDIHVLKPHS